MVDQDARVLLLNRAAAPADADYVIYWNQVLRIGRVGRPRSQHIYEHPLVLGSPRPPWTERPIFDMICYMSLDGMKRKTDVEAYLHENNGSGQSSLF